MIYFLFYIILFNINHFNNYESSFISKLLYIINSLQLNYSFQKIINFILSFFENKEFILDKILK